MSNRREMVEAIISRLRTGSPWWDLPGDFPSHRSEWWRFHHWVKGGAWDRVLTALQGEAHAAGASLTLRADIIEPHAFVA